MNAGLVGLMMHLINDNGEKSRKAAEKRQQEREDFVEKQRASLWEHQQSVLQAKNDEERGYKRSEEQRKEDEKTSHVAAMATLAKTGTPFTQLSPDHQVAMSGPYAGDLAKTAQAYEALVQNLASATTAADVAKAKHEATKAMDEETVSDALRPGLARNAQMEQTLKTATSVGGGVTPAVAANSINRVALSDDGSQHVFRNKSYTTPEQLNTEAAMASAKAMAAGGKNKSIADQLGFTKTATDDIDASGNPVVKVGNHYEVPPIVATQTAATQPATTSFIKPLPSASEQIYRSPLTITPPTATTPDQSQGFRLLSQPNIPKQEGIPTMEEIDAAKKLRESLYKQYGIEF